MVTSLRRSDAHAAFRPAPAGPVSLVRGHLARGVPIVRPEGNRSIGYRAAKRVLDIAGALALLAVLGPIMLVIFLVLCATTRGKPLFWQRRVGYLGRTFPLVKFRTMHAGAAALQHTVANESVGPVFKNRRDPRVTRIGRWLRRSRVTS